MELTRTRGWEYRVRIGRSAGDWAGSLAAAIAGHAEPPKPAPWPQRWRIFAVRAKHWAVRNELLPHEQPLPRAEELVTVPASLSLGGLRLHRYDLAANDGRGGFDLAALFGEARNRRCAHLFAALDCPTGLDLDVHAGGDYWMQWLVDGIPVFDTLATGNVTMLHEQAHRFRLRLVAGIHHLYVRVFSGNGGWGFASEATIRGSGPPALRIESRRRFTVRDPSRFAALAFDGEPGTQVRLNGHALAGPDRRMRYGRIPGLAPGLLRAGANELTRVWSIAASRQALAVLGLRAFTGSGGGRKAEAVGSLFGIPEHALRPSVGPFLGWADATTLTLSCRSEAVRPARLEIAGRCVRSPAGLIHRFTVPRLASGRSWPWTLQLGQGPRLRGVARTMPSGPPVDLAIYGDPSPQPGVLRRVLAAIAKARPDAALALGDLTSDGRIDQLWSSEYHALNPAFFASVPHLWIMGNHEERCPVFARQFILPGSVRRWSVAIAGCRFIGLDGLGDWSRGSSNARWLERRLAAAREPFIVVANHYPAWSSTPHAGLGDDGQPWQRTVREARDTILPLLARHRVSLYLNGHAHCYERCEGPVGPPCITSGGAGGFLYPALPDPRINSASRCFDPVHHWCRLRIGRDRLQCTAIRLDGTEIETVSVPARAP